MENFTEFIQKNNGSIQSLYETGKEMEDIRIGSDTRSGNSSYTPSKTNVGEYVCDRGLYWERYESENTKIIYLRRGHMGEIIEIKEEV